MLGTLWWRRGRNDLTSEHDRRAESMLEGRPPSSAKAWVLSRIAGRHMAADEVDEAVRIGHEAVRMAEELELDGVLVESLINVGTSLMGAGDRRGAESLERAIEVANRAKRSPVRAYGNYAEAVREFGELERSRELLELAVRAQEQRGSVSARRWLQGERAADLYWQGRWDEVVRITDERLGEADAGQPSWMDPEHRRLRAAVRLACGEVSAALDDVRKALEFCRVADDPQVLFPALASNAYVLPGRRPGRRVERARGRARRALVGTAEGTDALDLGGGLHGVEPRARTRDRAARRCSHGVRSRRRGSRRRGTSRRTARWRRRASSPAWAPAPKRRRRVSSPRAR